MPKYNLKIRKDTNDFEEHTELKNKELRDLIKNKLLEYHKVEYKLSNHQVFNMLNKNKGRHINPLLNYFVRIEYAK
tara:strand:- start:3447 stop:3674 length:228 start_codon:yes stop_codon:yes gene_type:complete